MNDFKHGKKPQKYFDIENLIMIIKTHRFILVSEEEYNNIISKLNKQKMSEEEFNNIIDRIISDERGDENE